MKVFVPAIDEKTRTVLTTKLADHFKYTEGDDLQAVVSEVLSDRDLFTFLAVFLADDTGLKLGTMSYWDDATVNIDYGLTIDFHNPPRQTKLFTAEYFGYTPVLSEGSRLNIMFPEEYLTSDVGRFCSNAPTPKDFVAAVNAVLQDPKQYVVPLRKSGILS